MYRAVVVHGDKGKGQFNSTYPPTVRVATPQGKQGIWLLTFPDRENTGNLVNLIFNLICDLKNSLNLKCQICNDLQFKMCYV